MERIIVVDIIIISKVTVNKVTVNKAIINKATINKGTANTVIIIEIIINFIINSYFIIKVFANKRVFLYPNYMHIIYLSILQYQINFLLFLTKFTSLMYITSDFTYNFIIYMHSIIK